MSLSALIRKGGLGTVASANPANSANEGGHGSGTLARLATLALASRQINESVIPPDPAAEARRSRVLAMLEEHPTAKYAVLTDTEADPEAVIVALAIRGQATCELRIPRDKWDGVLFLELLDRHSATVH